MSVIVASATPSLQAAMEATHHTPIIMAAAGDALRTGIVTNLARPGGNVTGLSLALIELAGKTVGLLRETLPRARRFACVVHSEDPLHRAFLAEAESSARRLGLQFRPAILRSVSGHLNDGHGGDPVAMGLARSVAGSGTNVTGLTTTPAPDIEAKRLQLVKELVPEATRIAFLGMKSDWDSPWGQRIRDAGRALGVTMIYAEHRPNVYDDAFSLIERERVNAVYLAANAPNWHHRRLIAEFARRNGLPTTSALRDYAEAGGLMSYGFDVLDNFRRAAGYVDKILKGAKPGELPIQQPSKFVLAINAKTARALGLTIPQSLLLRADEVIQ